MFIYCIKQRKKLLVAAGARLIVFCLSFSLIFAPSAAHAQSILNLPVPGTMVAPSPAFVPVLLKGMTIHPEDPLKFDFIIDSGNTDFTQKKVKEESERLVKYFLASMTVPKDDLWVNLSPYEDDRIIPQELGKTELGRDMLAQDYILKQLTASLMYPEEELGKKFWDRVYKKAEEQFGTSEIPVNTFNKVWILPGSATVYEHKQTVYVVDARLKVMLDSDYQALNYQNTEDRGQITENLSSDFSPLSSEIIREIIIPEIEKEVNKGENFAPLRQIYHSLILAKWYKETVKNSLLSQIYVDKNLTDGVETEEKDIKNQIYAQYMEAYKKGVYNYIKEDYDRLSNEVIPRKYFSGGERLTHIPLKITSSPVKESSDPKYQLRVKFSPQKESSSFAESSPVEGQGEDDIYGASSPVSPEEDKAIKARGRMSPALISYFKDNVRYFTLVGKPGAGKGTVSEVMLKQLNENLPEEEKFETLVMGDVVRAVMKLKAAKGTEKEAASLEEYAEYVPFEPLLPEEEVEAMKRGELITDQTVITIVQALLENDLRLADAKRLFFDGFPRTAMQLEAVQSGKIRHYGKPIKMDFYGEVDVPNEILFNRVNRRVSELKSKGAAIRPDDTPEKLETRLAEYDLLTAPMVEALRDTPSEDVLFLSIDGMTKLPENPTGKDLERGKAIIRGRLFNKLSQAVGISKTSSPILERKSAEARTKWHMKRALDRSRKIEERREHFSQLKKLNTRDAQSVSALLDVLTVHIKKHVPEWKDHDIENTAIELLPDARELYREGYDVAIDASRGKIEVVRGEKLVDRKDPADIEHIVEQLSAKDPKVRARSKRELEGRMDIRSVQPLILKLSDPDRQVRETAVTLLRFLLNRYKEAAVEASLTDEDVQILWEVFKRLHNKILNFRGVSGPHSYYISKLYPEALDHTRKGKVYDIVHESEGGLTVKSGDYWLDPDGKPVREKFLPLYHPDTSESYGPEDWEKMGYKYVRPVERTLLLQKEDIKLVLLEESKNSSSPISTDEEVGGIDLNRIGVDRQGSGVDIQFDPVEIQEIIDLGITGFAPVIINLAPLPSVLPLLGLEPKREEEFEMSSLN